MSPRERDKNEDPDGSVDFCAKFVALRKSLKKGVKNKDMREKVTHKRVQNIVEWRKGEK